MLKPRAPLFLFVLAWTASPDAAAQVIVGPIQPQPVVPLADGSFELPNLASGFCYGAFACTPPWSDSPWTFTSGAGVAKDGSGFTNQNGNAPDGDQVAFMQGGVASTITQSVQLVGGHYRVTMKAAQRIQGGIPNAQLVTVHMDGVEVDRIQPQDGTYAVFKSHSFHLPSGQHTLQLVAHNPAGGDNTMLIDQLKLVWVAQEDDWTNDSAWATGSAPGALTDAVIQAGDIVVLNTNAQVQSLTILGELHCANQDVSLITDYVLVGSGGRFECGSETSPFVERFTLTLRSGAGTPMMGVKFLGVAGGGVLELHGEERLSWTQITATVGSTSNALTTLVPTDWRSGDQIVIAPTNAVGTEGEILTVASVNGNTVNLAAPPVHTHYGQTSSYNNGLGKSWTLDERAEVGLLSRNVLIQGDPAAMPGIGGHVMVHAGAFARVSGVELHRMGQNNSLGRYPFHWHLAGSVPGQYIKNSSIHESYHRCVTVHGTHDAVVADNVCYDFVGHGYFLENGSERRNLFSHNLGILAKKPNPPGAPFLASDSLVGTAANGPGVFWVTHLDNDLVDNAAAGSEGTGFWFNQTNQNELQPLGTFSGNRAHSSRQGLSTCFEASGPKGIRPSNSPVMLDFTASNVEQGVWPCTVGQTSMDLTFRNMIVANSPNGMQAPNPVKFEDTLLVAHTANESVTAKPDTPWRGVQVYDQGFWMHTLHLVGFDRPGQTAFYPGGGAHKHASNRAENVTRQSSPNLFLDPNDVSQLGAGPASWGDVVHDLDGTMVGAGSAIVSDHPLMWDAGCTQPTSVTISGYACPYRYVHFRSEEGFAGDLVEATVLRSDGVRNTAAHTQNRYITEVMRDGPHLYSWRYEKGIEHKTLTIQLENADPTDTQIFEILDVRSGAIVSTPGWSSAIDLADLQGGAGSRYLWRDHSMFLKMDAVGPAWRANDLVQLCVSGSCAVDPVVGSLPSVTFRGPADGARITSGTTFKITAKVTDPDGIAGASAYLGTTAVTAAPVVAGDYWTWTVPMPAPGAYAVKVVGVDTTGTSFTALQQLFIGDTAPRVEITSIAPHETHDTAAPPTVAFTLHNWPLGGAGGKHLHLFVNGVDQLGHIASAAPIPLPALAQGKQDVKLALADGSSGTDVIMAVNDLVRIYGMTSFMLADFEDGVDDRASLTGNDVGVTEIAFAWGLADPVASRIDGEDDINYYDVNDDGAPSGVAVFRLDLKPTQDWSVLPVSQIEVKADANLRYDLYVVDATQGATLVGSWSAVTSAFPLPATSLIDEVIAVELRYSEASLPSGSPKRQHLRHIRLIP